MLSYCDDIMCRGRRSDVEWFFAKLGERFDIKEPTYLNKDNMLDHLGMVLIEDEDSAHLSMQNSIGDSDQAQGRDRRVQAEAHPHVHRH